MICPKCDYEWTPANTSDAFSVPVTEKMKSVAFIMGKSEACKAEWQKFLADLQGRSFITEKQRKFYSVIHKEVQGAWPERDETPPAQIAYGTQEPPF